MECKYDTAMSLAVDVAIAAGIGAAVGVFGLMTIAWFIEKHTDYI